MATASYEARLHGVQSAMSMAEARRRCPQAAYLAPRFEAYSAISATVMDTLRELSPAVEPISLDEAFVDLAAGISGGLDTQSVEALAARLKVNVRARTGLAASIGAGTSKLIAKIASDSGKPDGLVVVAAGDERALLDPLPVRALWGVGPAGAERLKQIGVTTVAQLVEVKADRLIAIFGAARGRGLHELARGIDARPVVADREIKSISIEDTFPVDLVDGSRLVSELDALAMRLAGRLRSRGRPGRTVTLKVRRHDFTTIARSVTLPTATDNETMIRDVARRLLESVDIAGGVRLLGIGMSSLTEVVQQDMFDPTPAEASLAHEDPAGEQPAASWFPGCDVVHDRFGRGWVERIEQDTLTVRFETPDSMPGVSRRLPIADEALRAAPPAMREQSVDDA